MFAARLNNELISVVIPACKGASGLEKTLAGIGGQRPAGMMLEILVANDGANAAVTEVCRRNGVFMVAIEPRCGSYFARNRALDRASGDLVVFLDAGITIPEDWLLKAISTLGKADYLACEIDIDAVLGPTAAEAFEKKNSYPIADYLRLFHFGVTGGLIVKKRLLQAVGDFDQRLFSGGDLEFGDRVYRAGFTQTYLASPVLLHPPRRARALFCKQFRVKIGHHHLARLYPGRFPSLSPSAALISILRALLPPHWHYIETEFSPGAAVPAWRRFFFLWLLKICRAFAGLIAVLIPVAKAPKNPKRSEWFDFSTHGR